MTERDSIIARMSPIELADFAAVGGLLSAAERRQAVKALEDREEAARRSMALARSVRIALETWWNRPVHDTNKEGEPASAVA